MSIGVLLFLSSFLYLDWTFSFFNLPYGFNLRLENKTISSQSINREDHLPPMRWYKQIYKRKGVWHYLTSPLYILVVLFLSILLLPGIFLSVTWYPWVEYITNDTDLSIGRYDLYLKNIERFSFFLVANRYTFAFNLAPIAAIIICPLNGFLLGFKADKSKLQSRCLIFAHD